MPGSMTQLEISKEESMSVNKISNVVHFAWEGFVSHIQPINEFLLKLSSVSLILLSIANYYE